MFDICVNAIRFPHTNRGYLGCLLQNVCFEHTTNANVLEITLSWNNTPMSYTKNTQKQPLKEREGRPDTPKFLYTS